LKDNPVERDAEFLHFTDAKGFAIQWHPEMMQSDEPATKYILKYIEEHL
jgi:gamma-glutamyl-gamma-aminobutyrate hydrolase PuuD